MIWDKIKERINETFKSDVDNEIQDEAKVLQATDEKNVEKEKTSENKNTHYPVLYAPFAKHIAEKYGLGDAEDFQRRINAINKFVDNKEARFNVQRLGALIRLDAIKNGNTKLLRGMPQEDVIDTLQSTVDLYEEMLKNEGLKIYTQEELDKVLMCNKYIPSRKESVDVAKDAIKSTSEFSKKGQKTPFKNVSVSKNARQGVAKATKKFNIIKEAVDVLSNAKLNAALDIFLTPTPLYEPSIEDIRKKNGLDKLDFSLKEAEQPSDNQTE